MENQVDNNVNIANCMYLWKPDCLQNKISIIYMYIMQR